MKKKVKFKSLKFEKESIEYGYIKPCVFYTVSWISSDDGEVYYQLKNSHVLFRSDLFEDVEEL